MKPTKRGSTDCRRFKSGDQAALAVYSIIIYFDATIGSNSYTICTMHVKNIQGHLTKVFCGISVRAEIKRQADIGFPTYLDF